MSKIKIAELQNTKAELSRLDENQITEVIGGRDFRNLVNVNVSPKIATIVQVQNSVNLNFSFGGGDIVNVNSLVANAGVNQ